VAAGKRKPGGVYRGPATPTQPLEDIDREVLGDDVDEESGDAPEITREQAKELGAINAEAVQSNRKRKTILSRKRDGEKGVPWNERDGTLLYGDIISLWPAAQILIAVKRISGGPGTTWYIQGRPRNGMELYEAIRKQCHGQAPDAEYQIIFKDISSHEERGRGYVIMPSTEFDDMATPATGTPREPRDAPAAPAPSMPYGAPPMGAPPGYSPPMGFAGYPPQAAPAQAAAHAGAIDPMVAVNFQQQLSQIAAQNEALRVQNEQLRQQLASGGSPRAPVPNAPPPPVVVMPQAAPAPAVAPPAKVEVPSGYALASIPGIPSPVLVPLSSIGLGGTPATAPAPAQAAAVAPAASPPATMQEQLTNAAGMMKTAFDFAKTVQGLAPAAAAAPAGAPLGAAEGSEASEEEESPTKIVKMGDMNLVTNKEDGGVRLVDTLVANAPAVMTWIDKQRKEYLDRQAAANGQPIPSSQESGGGVAPPSIPH
jgi:hypothetical protein